MLLQPSAVTVFAIGTPAASSLDVAVMLYTLETQSEDSDWFCLTTMVAISISKLNHRLYASCSVGGYQVRGQGQVRGQEDRGGERIGGKRMREWKKAVVHIIEMGIQ